MEECQGRTDWIKIGNTTMLRWEWERIGVTVKGFNFIVPEVQEKTRAVRAI